MTLGSHFGESVLADGEPAFFFTLYKDRSIKVSGVDFARMLFTSPPHSVSVLSGLTVTYIRIDTRPLLGIPLELLNRAKILSHAFKNAI